LSDKFSSYIKHQIDKINTHLPRKTLSLKKIILDEEKGYTDRTGSFIEYRLEEIEEIKSLIPKQFWGKVLLPIIITRRRDLGEGAFMVSGSDENFYLIKSSITNLPKYDLWRLNTEGNKTIYKLNLRTIRKKWNTTSVLAFA